MDVVLLHVFTPLNSRLDLSRTKKTKIQDETGKLRKWPQICRFEKKTHLLSCFLSWRIRGHLDSVPASWWEDFYTKSISRSTKCHWMPHMGPKNTKPGVSMWVPMQYLGAWMSRAIPSSANATIACHWLKGTTPKSRLNCPIGMRGLSKHGARKIHDTSRYHGFRWIFSWSS